MTQNKYLINSYYNDEDPYVTVKFLMTYMEQVMPAKRIGKRQFSGIKTYQPGDSGIYMSNDPMLQTLIAEGIARVDHEQTENRKRVNKEAMKRTAELLKKRKTKEKQNEEQRKQGEER